MRWLSVVLVLVLGCTAPTGLSEIELLPVNRLCWSTWIEWDELVERRDRRLIEIDRSRSKVEVTVDTVHMVDAGIECAESIRWTALTP